MGKLYDAVKKEIDNLEHIDNKDFKSLLVTSLSTSKIKQLYNRIITHYHENYPEQEIEGLSLDDFTKSEGALNRIEVLFGEDAVNSILNDLNKTKEPDLSFLDKPYTNEYVHFLELENAVKDTIKIHYQNIMSEDRDPNEVPGNIIKAYQKEVKNLIEKDNFVGPVSKKTDKEYQFIQEFIYKPAKFFVNGNKNIFKFDSPEDMNLFIQMVDNSVDVVKASVDETVFKDIREQFDNSKIIETKDLADNITKLVKNYYDLRQEEFDARRAHALRLPSLGSYLYEVKNNLSNIVLNRNIELGVDKYSKFIKDYLDDPIECFSNYLDAKTNNIAENDLIKNMIFEEEDAIDFEKLANDVEEFKNDILSERDNYDNYAQDKKDSWKEYQNYKKEWFMKHFNVQLKNSTIQETINSNKGGFFENLFGTTSKEYKNFAKALSDITEDGPGKGDLDSLKENAQLYLYHKLESYNGFYNGYDENEINNLDSTSKGRVELCLSVIQAIDDAKKAIDEKLNPDDFVYEKIDLPEMHDEFWSNNIINDNFHKNLQNDSKLENEKLNEAILDIDEKDLDNDIDLNNSK